MADAELAFFESLARSRGASSALLYAEDGRVVLVKPTYKAGWSLPGGVIDEGESPWGACRRECVEEIGFVPCLGGLVCVDWVPPHLHPDGRPSTVFVFVGELGSGGWQRVRLPEAELSAARLVEPGAVGGYLRESTARRVGRAHAAARAGRAVYLEHGHPVG